MRTRNHARPDNSPEGCLRGLGIGLFAIMLLCGGLGAWEAVVDSPRSLDQMSKVHEGMSGDEVVRAIGKPPSVNRLNADEVEWEYGHFYVDLKRGRVAHVQPLKW